MHTHSSQSSQHVLKIESLPFPERFLIWAIRVSFSSVMSTEESTHHLRQASRFVGVLEILPWVQSYIGVIGAVLHDSRVFVDIHSPACPMVGRDEWHLIQTLAALRASNRSLAEAHLEVFLPAKVIQVCTNCAVQLATALDRAGWALQLMPVTKTELLVTGGVTHPATLHLSGAHAALNLTCSRRRRHCMSDKSFRSEPGQFIATTDAEQTLQ